MSKNNNANRNMSFIAIDKFGLVGGLLIAIVFLLMGQIYYFLVYTMKVDKMEDKIKEMDNKIKEEVCKDLKKVLGHEEAFKKIPTIEAAVIKIAKTKPIENNTPKRAKTSFWDNQSLKVTEHQSEAASKVVKLELHLKQ
ncbi:hypothetical protein [Candidatus Magnetominusculus xianensis]|uniref:Uncharacterized protein n=1 Tax=Candidatus Magnetominusculus xianensis TaxID=1748249 RepID=A0ABR5SF09_9BACT|nr:hypothetical protein [Candidatus Magnetominusculus xianensis]KWT83011.1 hypothetical protein ASN18_2285 [Candidatus Magnetominusculus xianensis]MBF0402721.1 hypothetical protein [Nitrospirota bacterium]